MMVLQEESSHAWKDFFGTLMTVLLVALDYVFLIKNSNQAPNRPSSSSIEIFSIKRVTLLPMESSPIIECRFYT